MPEDNKKYINAIGQLDVRSTTYKYFKMNKAHTWGRGLGHEEQKLKQGEEDLKKGVWPGKVSIGATVSQPSLFPRLPAHYSESMLEVNDKIQKPRFKEDEMMPIHFSSRKLFGLFEVNL